MQDQQNNNLNEDQINILLSSFIQNGLQNISESDRRRLRHAFDSYDLYDPYSNNTQFTNNSQHPLRRFTEGNNPSVMDIQDWNNTQDSLDRINYYSYERDLGLLKTIFLKSSSKKTRFDGT